MSGSKSENILDYGNEDILKFIKNKIKNSNNVKEDILDKIKYVSGEIVEGDREDHSSQGFYYERLWDLCIKFGATNLTLDAIPDKTKPKKTMDIIGCNPIELKNRFEFLFEDWMSWDNYGYGKNKWVIDHKIPLSSAKNIDDLYSLCHYTNLQPLSWEDNMKKGNKLNYI